MDHRMKLRPVPFEQIRFGAKTIELRLYDEKRRQIKPGDRIIFCDTEDPDLQLTAEVVGLHRFPTFADLFAFLPINRCGFDGQTAVEDAVAEMRQYYSADQEKMYGVLGIEIQLVR